MVVYAFCTLPPPWRLDCSSRSDCFCACTKYEYKTEVKRDRLRLHMSRDSMCTPIDIVHGAVGPLDVLVDASFVFTGMHAMIKRTSAAHPRDSGNGAYNDVHA